MSAIVGPTPTASSNQSYMYFMARDGSSAWKTHLGVRAGIDVIMWDHHAYAAWSDFPTSLPSRALLLQRGTNLYGANDYGAILMHAKPTSGQNAYGVLAVQAIGGADHSTRFNILLRGSGSTDYETVFSADYNSTYYWKKGDDSDITHQFISSSTTVRGILGYDQSNSSINIAGGTGTIFTNIDEIMVYDGGADVLLDSTPATSSGGGIWALGDVDANTFGIGAALYLKADGDYAECDADAAATMPCSALALESGTGVGKRVLLVGYLKDASYSFTVGAIVYVSTTLGGLTTTAPSGTGDFVQAVGIATETTALYFNPDFAMGEIV
jgi:hypothetical protein